MKKANNRPFTVVEIKEQEIEEAETLDEKTAKKNVKKAQKAEKREKRKLKKELKIAFNTQHQRAHTQATTDVGEIKTGVSVKKIY